jgi:membrane protein DedA with SNARE-associated domain
MLTAIKIWASGVIAKMGYTGLFLMTVLGSANVPIPSELVMPLGGMLASEGKMSVHLVALIGFLGSMVGSAINYWLGRKLGRPFLEKYGKFFFVRRKELEHADVWFKRYGASATLIGRFVPVVRTFVSLPAGIYEMDFGIFLIYTAIGNFVWCYLWAYVGLGLGANWSVIEKYMHIADAVVIVCLVALVAWFVANHIRKRPAMKVDR